MSTETASTFYYAFTQLFNCLARANGQEIMFEHIHGYGISTIVVDMDTKQAAGECSSALTSAHECSGLIVIRVRALSG